MPGDGKQVVRSLLFWERESSLIDQTIHLFDWNKGEKRKMPPFVKLAYTLIAFPSLRELDCVAVGDRVDLTAPWDDEATREDFEVKFERLQEKLPTLYTPEFIELVRAAVETRQSLVVVTSPLHSLTGLEGRYLGEPEVNPRVAGSSCGSRKAVLHERITGEG
jgi:hypothetical protein